MLSKIDVGRIVGFMLLMQVIGGISVNLFLTAPLYEPPGFMIHGDAYSLQIGVSVLLGLITSGLSLVIAIMAFPVFRVTTPALSIGLIALSAVALSVAAVEHIGVMSMVSFSEAYSGAGNADQEVLASSKVIVASARNWAHYIGLVLSGCTLFVFYLVLYYARLVPRWLAGLGLIAVLLQLSSVSRPLLGNEVIFPLLAPLGLTQILLSIWLMARGFNHRRMESG
jgi:hypothetical protein